MAELYIHM